MSTTDILLAYRRERLPFAMFAVISLLLGASGLTGTAASISSWLYASAAALLLVAQFRVWDDLADRDVDRLLHPERVLAGNINVTPFRVGVVLLGAVNAVLLAARSDGSARLVLFFAVCACFGIWYGIVRREAVTPSTLTEAHVVLLKYPIIVHLAGPSVSDAWVPRITTMLVVFVGASAYEILHDESVAARVRARQILALDAVVFTAVMIAFATSRFSPEIATVAGGLLK